MATPIAHKGVTVGAKALAMTLIDLFTDQKLLDDSWDYFKNVQSKDVKYTSFVDAKTPPAIHLNSKIMEKFKPELKKYYYDPSKYNTYLDQLGIKYPTLEKK